MVAQKKAVVEQPDLTIAEQVAQDQAVAEAKQTAVAPFIDSSWLDDAGAGHEGADKDSYAIPFLRVLQTNSPQCDEGDGSYIDGAKPGMIYNTVTGALYDGREKGVELYPCAYQRRFLRWGPRGGDGAAMRGEYLPEEADKLIAEGSVRELDGRLYFAPKDEIPDPKKHDRLVDTRSHYFVLRTPEGQAQQVLLPLSSTQIKKSKNLQSMLLSAAIPANGRMVNPPTWMNRVTMTTQPESNDQGKWYGVRFTANGFNTNDNDLYQLCKMFHESVTSGAVNVNYEHAVDEGASGDSEKF